jgi:hypothetical protein
MENPNNCSGVGLYINIMHAYFLKQMPFLYTGGIQQIIPTKKKLKMAEIQSLPPDMANFDAYRTQLFLFIFKFELEQIAVGCDGFYDACTDYAPLRLEYNKDPNSDHWSLVRPLCLPDHAHLSECQPRHYHTASIYTRHAFPSWTLVTIPLTEKTFSRYL